MLKASVDDCFFWSTALFLSIFLKWDPQEEKEGVIADAEKDLKF